MGFRILSIKLLVGSENKSLNIVKYYIEISLVDTFNSDSFILCTVET